MASAAPELPVHARDQAFEHLYHRYLKDVYHYALALLRNPADAEDVTQTTFMNAYRAYKRGEQPIKPQNWLIKIAHNVARTRYARASRRVKEVPLEDHVFELAVPEEDKPDIEAVLEALGRLPLNQRAALVMRELEGRSYAEIADTLGVSVAAVETLIFRARRSLRLKASALRTLAAVPLPTSLTHLFEAGGFAGGGAIVGSGFLLKAAVAIVAGAVATSVGGDHAKKAPAAANPGVTYAAAGNEQSPRLADAHAQSSTRKAVGSHGVAPTRIRGRVVTASASRFAEREPAQPATAGGTTPTAASAHAPQPASPRPAPAAHVSDTVETIAGAVPSPSVPDVALPPTPSVPLPAPPPLPQLPKLP
jgi:RNA polymerase sigma factor (sigma-70 family)